MFNLSQSLLNAGLFTAFITAVGVSIPAVPEQLVLFLIAVAGSGAAVGFRALNGHIKDRKSRWIAFFSGILFAYVAVPWVNKVLTLEGLESGVFVLLISLIGARVAKYLATDFSVEKFIDGVLSRFTKG